ncbi:MAG: NAD-dependent epimerase/dehydratase family protein [Alphaproteobacteria bacterium]|nr:NAD-dependent epimerase/dehydratase family protein [Alphaproteobacteria bacterium]
MTVSAPIIILGGRSLVAPYLMQRVSEIGGKASVVSRREMTNLPAGFKSVPMDITRKHDLKIADGSIVISLLPIWVLAENLSGFSNAKTLIAVSSTSRFSKSTSADPKERAVADTLEQAEEKLAAWSKDSGVSFTILRPTLIYDGINDKNIARMIGFIRKFRFVPVASPATGLRQPIHADDVAQAIMKAILNANCKNKAFNIAGSEVLTYRKMVEKVFESQNRKPRILLLPAWLLREAFRLASFIGIIKEKHFGFSVFQRMNEDLIFNCAEGLKTLDYKPRGFKL